MRISSSLFFRTGLDSINAQQADLLHIYQQMGTGKRMVNPSDDPLAAAQSINLGQSQALNKRYEANRNVLKQDLGAEENVLKSSVLALQDVKTQLVNAGNGVLADADRRSLAEALRSAKTNILNLANATDGNGQFIFSGYQGDQRPFSDTGTWNGATGQRMIQVDQTRQLAGSDLGSDVFARSTPGSRNYLTSANTANTGSGQIGSPTITDLNGSHIGHAFAIAFVADPTDPSLPPQYQVTVTDASGTVVETQTPQPYNAATGGVSLPGGVSVQFSGQPAVGDTFQVQQAASLSTADLNMFKSFDDIIAALESDTLNNSDPTAMSNLRNAVNTAIQRFDVHYDNVLTIQSSVGARMAEVAAVDLTGSDRSLSYSNRLSQLEDISYYEASSQLQMRTSALDAAALAFRKIQNINLLNYRNS